MKKKILLTMMEEIEIEFEDDGVLHIDDQIQEAIELEVNESETRWIEDWRVEE